MSNDEFAIRVDGISKVYRLGVKDEMHDTFGKTLMSFLRKPLHNFRKYKSLYRFDDIDMADAGGEGRKDILWALRDVSFEVKRGEVVGIIGTNGAGKSTLLKILSRITPPTKGRIEIRGRVSSLLEVGTGFHQELTGRENVYLNGTILGMRKAEVDRKFDEIVEFSGVEAFLDTPVKRYSSGMRVRLAFAVAAHLEPEILIVDEVLAVGDVGFQKKCMNKMQEVGSEGRTVLFVSHSMPAITRMCERVVLLNHGRVAADGEPHQVVSAYIKGTRESAAENVWPDREKAPGGEVARLRALRLKTEDNRITDAFDIRCPIGVEIEIEVLKGGYVILPTFSIWNSEGINVCVAVDVDPEWRKRQRPPGRYVCTGWVPGNFLAEGAFSINTTLWLQEPVRNKEYHVTDAVSFQVIDSLEGDSARGDYIGDLPGVTRPLLKWETTYFGADNPATPESKVALLAK